jgi:V-type H+-transporting ATPase subunit a
VSAFQRNFVNEVRKCDEMERRVRFFEAQVNKEKKDILEEHNKNPEDLGLVQIADITVDPKKIQMEELEVF